MARPGGKRTITTTLEFITKMSGISDAIKNMAGITSHVNNLNEALAKTDQHVYTMRDVMQKLAKSENVNLLKVSQTREILDYMSKRSLEKLAEYLELQTINITKRQNLIDTIEKELNIRKEMDEYYKNAYDITDQMIDKTSRLGETGQKSLSLIQEALSSVPNVESEVTSGINILTKSFEKATDNVKKFGEEYKSAISIIRENFKIMTPDIEYKTSKDGRRARIVPRKIETGSEHEYELRQAMLGKGGDILAAQKGIGDTIKTMENLSSKTTTSKTAMSSLTKAIGATSAETAVASGSMAEFAVALNAIPVAGQMAFVVIATITAALELLKDGIKMVVKNMEEYRLANYRAVGSIDELLDVTYEISIATGLSNRQVVESIKSLSHAGVTIDELSEKYGNGKHALTSLATAQGNFNRATNVSNQTTSAFIKQLVISGMSIDDMSKSLNVTTSYMAEFGITGQEASSIISTLTQNIKSLNAVYDSSQIKEYTKSMMEFAGAAKRAGVDASSVIGQISTEARSLKGATVTLMAFSGAMGKMISGGAKEVTIDRLVVGYQNILKSLEGMDAGYKDIILSSMGINDELRATLDNELKHREVIEAKYRQYMSAEQAHQKMLEQIRQERKEREEANKATEAFNESLNTVSQKLQDAFTPVKALFAKIARPLVDIFNQALDATKPLHESIMAIADAFSPPVDFMFIGLKTLFKIYGVINSIVGGVIKLAAWIFKLTIVEILVEPFKAIGDYISNAVLWVQKLFTRIGDATGNIAQQFQKTFGPIVHLIKGIVQLFIDSFKYAINNTIERFKKMFEPITNFIGGIAKWFKDSFESVIGGLKQLFVKLFQPITNAIISIVQWFNKIFDRISNYIRALKPFLKFMGLWNDGLEEFTNASKAANNASETLAKSSDKFGDALKEKAKPVIDDANRTLDKIGQIETKVEEKSTPEEIIKAHMNIASRFKPGVEAAKYAKIWGERYTSPANAEFHRIDRPRLPTKPITTRPDLETKQTEGKASPVIGVQYLESTSKNIDSKSLVDLSRESVSLLNQILHKEDPHTKRIADAVENPPPESKQPLILRNRTGFGEKAIRW